LKELRRAEIALDRLFRCNQFKETLTLARYAKFAYLMFAAPLALAAPAMAQQTPAASTSPAAPTTPATPADPAAPADATAMPADGATTPAPATTAREMTPDEIAAFNQAVTDFTAGQSAQQAGDNAGAVAKYDAAIPAIRTAVEADPSKIDNVNFLANALYADAAAYGAMGQMDKVVSLYDEALPYWRKVVEAKPEDTASRNILAGMLIQMGNQKLAAQDTDGADPYYQEALTLARKSAAAQPADAVSKNILLSALIGASQTTTEEGLRDEALNMGKAMMADGTIDATNRPSIEIMTGAKAS
jgi:tetratricopeptide (TPR) repeat protein|tara:strand:+ start:1002 stop:1907 length:906 start_codon:yes stop_codon:yes gene_type:complete